MNDDNCLNLDEILNGNSFEMNFYSAVDSYGIADFDFDFAVDSNKAAKYGSGDHTKEILLDEGRINDAIKATSA